MLGVFKSLLKLFNRRGDRIMTDEVVVPTELVVDAVAEVPAVVPMPEPTVLPEAMPAEVLNEPELVAVPPVPTFRDTWSAGADLFKTARQDVRDAEAAVEEARVELSETNDALSAMENAVVEAQRVVDMRVVSLADRKSDAINAAKGLSALLEIYIDA